MGAAWERHAMCESAVSFIMSVRRSTRYSAPYYLDNAKRLRKVLSSCFYLDTDEGLQICVCVCVGCVCVCVWGGVCGCVGVCVATLRSQQDTYAKSCSAQPYINLLGTKLVLSHLKTQSVPHSKHFLRL